MLGHTALSPAHRLRAPAAGPEVDQVGRLGAAEHHYERLCPSRAETTQHAGQCARKHAANALRRQPWCVVSETQRVRDLSLLKTRCARLLAGQHRRAGARVELRRVLWVGVQLVVSAARHKVPRAAQAPAPLGNVLRAQRLLVPV